MEDVIKFLGSSTLLLAAVAWLIRSLAGNLLSKDLESFKRRLESEATIALERLKHELGMSAVEHGLLHERRAKTIAELYARLIDFLGAAQSFANLAEWSSEPSKPEKAEILAERSSAFREYFLKNKQ